MEWQAKRRNPTSVYELSNKYKSSHHSALAAFTTFIVQEFSVEGSKYKQSQSRSYVMPAHAKQT